ncbi:MAG: valine--tRNA ligase [Pseudomonadota bacterium]
MLDLPKNYDFALSEKKWQKFWKEQKVYQWIESEPRKNTFVVDTPPPTVSGQLHMGHIFSYTQTDFVVRFMRMRGKNIFYPMGFDDNGLPTERLVEKQRKVRANSMPREEFIKICEEVVAAEEEIFRNLFNSVGLSVDWSLEYQTISPSSRAISQMSFLDLVGKDQIYRSEQPMLWDPVDQTALAQADIEDKERESVMNDIAFQVESGEQIVIATTRPELLPACVAVFYHPDDVRYKHLKGQNAVTPLFGAKVPLLEDDMVQIDKGTGLVMCCTFGDNTDVLWWKKHNLPLKVIVDKMGRISGVKVSEARANIIEELKAANLLLAQTPIIQNVKCAERSGAPLEILTTAQWFVKTLEYKDAMLRRSNELNWHPKSMKIRLDNWINGLSWDWCISRQRFFGVPFPVWYSKREGEEGKPIFAEVDQLPVDPLKDLPRGYKREEVEADHDVMDTWATSAVSPQLSSHGISEEFALDIGRHKKLFPGDLRPQAHEIIRVWTFNTILKSHLHQDVLPWKNIMISGWCLAADKSKMSKSKGSSVTPDGLLSQYGADTLRYWSGGSKLGADTVYSEDVIKNGKRLVNKLWNATKFAGQHLNNKHEGNITHTTDKWLISKLHQVVDTATKEFEKFEYAGALAAVEEFFWKDFCDNYLEMAKSRTYNEDASDADGQQSAIRTLHIALDTILKLFAPFMPYITEELYQAAFGNTSEKPASLHARGSWPRTDGYSFDLASLEAGGYAIAVLDLVRKSKAEKNLSIKAEVEVLEFSAGVQLPEDLLRDLANVTTSKAIRQDGLGEVKAKIEYLDNL